MKNLKDATVAFRVTEEEKERLTVLAHQADIPVSQLLRKLVQEFLSKEN